MRTTHRVRLALAAVVAASVAVPSAQASHGADDPNWVEQAGNGSGATAPVIPGFQAVSALYDGLRFPACNSQGSCASRPGVSKYISWGLKTIDVGGTPSSVLHMVQLGDDGISPQNAQVVYLQDTLTGQDVPFVFSDPRALFDIVNEPRLQGGPFAIYYRAVNGPASSTDIGDLRRAVSIDGVHFTNETKLSDTGTGTPVVSAARSTYGPTDVIVQTGSGLTCAAGPTFPWNCKYVMVYDAVSPSNHNLAVAGSTDGLAFTGIAANILGLGAGGAWDDNGVTGAKIRKIGSTYTMFYLGSQAPVTACLSGDSACWSLGVATSTNGLTWTKSANNPVVASTRYDFLGGTTPSTLWMSPVLDDGTSHGKLYIAKRDNSGARNTFLASTTPTPPVCPAIRVASPQGGFLNASKPFPIDVYMNDAIGTLLGIDLQTLSITIDGNAVGGITTEDTIVGTQNNAPLGKRAKVAREVLGTIASGAHTLVVSVADRDGNTCSVSVNFTVDTIAPVTTVTAAPTGPALALLNGAGTFAGTTTDVGTGISRIRANVTNPLGLVKSYHSSDPSGWQITKTNANSWSWVFTGPILDPHFAVPGDYRISFLGTDLANNQEGVTPANTVTLLVL